MRSNCIATLFALTLLAASSLVIQAPPPSQNQTIRVGDYCKIGNQSGTVEDIGLRSTSLRTDDRTILTVPNGQLSAMNIENFAMKEKIFFHHTIGIRRETTAEQMRALLDALRKLLAADARLEPSTLGVRLIKCQRGALVVVR